MIDEEIDLSPTIKVIDPVECCMAVIGIQPILSREVEKVKLADVKEMQGLTKQVYKEAKAIVNGENSSVPLTAVPYKKMLASLTDNFDQGQLEEMVAKFPPSLHAISSDYLIDALKLVELLRNLFPVTTKETLLGPENIMPSALAIRKFATLLDVLDDPRRTIAHIACGSLLKSQAEIVKQVYPSFSECLTHALKEAASDAKAAKKSFVLPSRLEIGYGVWAGIPRVNPRLASKLQANFANADKEKPAPSGQEGTSTSVAAKESMTGTQVANYNTTLPKG